MNINANRRMKEWRVFTKIVETQSITLAAAAMYIEPSTVSKSLSLLESELGIILIERSTRNIKVTQTGMEIYERVKVIIHDMDFFTNEILEKKNNIEGVLRIAAPTIICEFLLPEWILEFQHIHKHVYFYIRAFDKYTELSPHDYDIIIRTVFFTRKSMVCHKMDNLNLIMCASQSYIERNPTINHPKDLLNNLTLNLSHQSLSYPIILKKQHEVYHLHKSDSKINTDNILSQFNLMLKGKVIAVATPSWLAYDYLHNEKIERLLPDWQIAELPIFILWRPRKIYSKLFLEFVDFLADAWGKRNKIEN
ncbi:LysR family transcriptional regulator [Yersinia pekkanenii]|uniref:LysR family transcriptional regulator n=1 Tax=Yersinia pekkanenii TaxID=1288385 RepID=A0A0T9Q8Y2_9GAMM|nr:LysR family transcriptional regulator [Yersinia pekkanenii]CNI00784.1 LysR family transcriptional regulator [Yersinia pekkanenii]CRY63568.1 LysR family transcriptional regulator [Yersinia pekkanenii]